MVKKEYDWSEGVALQEHTKRKHKILREYFFQYLLVRCQLPQQAKFRLAIIDGFAGGGRYVCGSPGSPIIFLEELEKALNAVNAFRASQRLSPIEIECLLILNDDTFETVNILRENVTPIEANIRQTSKGLHIKIVYFNDEFEATYQKIKSIIQNGRYRNVLFNLDQCGHSNVEEKTLIDIVRSYPSAEIFYTFAIQTLITFLGRRDPALLNSQLRHTGLDSAILENLNDTASKKTWLGTAEKLVFECFRDCAPFVSPFSIHNPEGWKYWLIHFASSYRARQVYNDILHKNSNSQAHFGRAGLNMLSYDPRNEGSLYLFDDLAREAAKAELLEDIPRLISESGDAMGVADFYAGIYNATPAHTDDMHMAIIENPDVEVITPAGGERRKPNTINVNDVLRLKNQRTFFPMFLDAKKLGD